jgi:hypothetical protein
VDTEYFAGYDGGNGEGIKYVDKRFPDFDTCTTFTFIIESIN